MIIVDKPYERLITYEFILIVLENSAPKKYKNMHKGTPFYYLSWLAFTATDYEKGHFFTWMQQLVRDIRLVAQTSTPDSWQDSPAASFLLLDEKKSRSFQGQAINS